MDQRISGALQRDLTIDITTRGRRTGQPRRIEIWFHRVDGKIYITGSPGKRDWYANLLSDPHFTFHLKHSARADLPARARPINSPQERRRILAPIVESHSHPDELQEWVEGSPLVEVTLLER